MATIIVEDGTGLTNSNSYVSEANLVIYAADRGKTITGIQADLLIKAMDYIESLPFNGYKYTDAQALQWPRGNVSIDGYSVAVTTIPQLLIDAVCEIAISIDEGIDPLANEGREIEKEKIGPIETQYSKNSRNYTYLKAAETKLSKLLRYTGVCAAVIRG